MYSSAENFLKRHPRTSTCHAKNNTAVWAKEAGLGGKEGRERSNVHTQGNTAPGSLPVACKSGVNAIFAGLSALGASPVAQVDFRFSLAL